MSSEFLLRITEEEHPVLPLVLRFNFSLLNDILPEHLLKAGITQELKEKLLLCRKTVEKMSIDLSWLTGDESLNEREYSFSIPSSRLALLDGDTLLRLATLTGAVVCRGEISKCILKSDRMAVKEKLSDADYNFAIKKSPLLIPQKSLSLITDDLSADMPKALDEKIDYAGWRVVLSCMGEIVENKNILGRLSLKLPEKCKEFLNSNKRCNEEKSWNIVYRILTKEVSSSWAPCFS